MRLLAVPMLLLSLGASVARADDAAVLRARAPGSVRLSALRVHNENDQGARFLGDTDRWYTAGTAFEFSFQPCWAERLAARMPDACGFGKAQTGAGFVLGTQFFTPEDISEPDLIEDDRPYAAYLYGGAFWQRSNRRVLDHLQLDVGAIGPSLGAEHVQRFFHEWRNYPDPQGWDNQLDDEVTVQAYARRKWRFEPTSARDPVRFQVIPQADLALGTVYRNVSGGVLVRAGFRLPDDFGPARLADPGTATRSTLVRGLSGYVFGRASGRLVEHNLFLDGNTFTSSHEIAKERFVGEAQTGFELSYGFGCSSFSLSFYATWQSREFQDQRERHLYTTISLSYLWLR